MVASVLYLIQKSIVNHFRKFIFYEYMYVNILMSLLTCVLTSCLRNSLNNKKVKNRVKNQQKMFDFVVIIIYIYYYKNFSLFEKLPIYYR